MKRNVILGLLFIFIAQVSQAQNAWNWPEDKQTAETKNALYTDNLKAGNYRAAANELKWLFVNAPDLNPSIYIQGAKIYEALAEAEKDPKQAVVYEDSALLMYDKRMEFFNNEEYIRDRKAYLAYKYKSDEPGKYPELLELYAKLMEQPVTTITDNNELFYIDIARRYKAGGGDISDEKILKIYETVTGVLDEKLAAGKNTEKITSLKVNVDGVLTDAVDIDCDFIENNLAPKLTANPTDVTTANKIVSFAVAGQCTSLPIFLTAAEVVHNETPNYGIAKVLGVTAMADGNYDRAEKYLNEAIELTEEAVNKGEAHMLLAEIASKRGQKAAARDHARQAASVDPSKASAAYTFIGDLYFTSFEQCAGGESMVQDRAVFIAAYNMYQRAGNSARMANAKEQFPSAEEIFNEAKEIGQTVTVGCWVGETVTLDKR